MAIEAHLAVTGTLPCNVAVLLEGEEEIGSPHIAEFVREHRDLLKADLVVTADGPLHTSGAPVVTFGVRGVASFELRAKTASRDMHSGNYGGVAPNAIWTLVHLLATMKNAAGEITIEGLHDRIVPPTNAEREAAATLPLDQAGIMADLGLKRLDAPADRPFYDRLMFHPTLTINGLHGGYGGAGSKTVLPAEAIAKCDIRLVEAMTPEDVFEKVAAHVRKHAPEVEFVPQGGMLPSKTPFSDRFAPAVIAASRTGPGRSRCSFRRSAAACRTMSSPRSSACRPMARPTPTPTRRTTRRTRTWSSTSSTAASGRARRCWRNSARCRPEAPAQSSSVDPLATRILPMAVPLSCRAWASAVRSSGNRAAIGCWSAPAARSSVAARLPASALAWRSSMPCTTWIVTPFGARA